MMLRFSNHLLKEINVRKLVLEVKKVDSEDPGTLKNEINVNVVSSVSPLVMLF